MRVATRLRCGVCGAYIEVDEGFEIIFNQLGSLALGIEGPASFPVHQCHIGFDISVGPIVVDTAVPEGAVWE